MSLFELILLFSVLINIYLLFKWVSSKKEIKPLKKEVEVALNDVDLEKNNYATLLSQKKASEIRLGQIAEQFVPFIENFPYDPKRARFIGSPIDLMVFGDDEIVFLEIKTGKSRLNANQTRIKKQIEEKKVKWDVIRVS
jgi:predicted Holliday junction resolvase-like endonuclease